MTCSEIRPETSDPETTYNLVGFEIGINDSGAAEIARCNLEKYLIPASDDDLNRALLRCRAFTAARDNDAVVIRAQIDGYRVELRKFPGDAAMPVLLEWPSEHKFWPTWFELKTEIDKRWEKRRLLRDALDRALSRKFDSQSDLR